MFTWFGGSDLQVSAESYLSQVMLEFHLHTPNQVASKIVDLNALLCRCLPLEFGSPRSKPFEYFRMKVVEIPREKGCVVHVYLLNIIGWDLHRFLQTIGFRKFSIDLQKLTSILLTVRSTTSSLSACIRFGIKTSGVLAQQWDCQLRHQEVNIRPQLNWHHRKSTIKCFWPKIKCYSFNSEGFPRWHLKT